ncbi:TPA: hypothetical protein ACJEU7_001270 [Acinetobacter baumannii]|uniref:hypothetical protein n=1 Tax=Acinetobacter baumannii TaxID=470 RepID=UPI0022547DFD|nr:hypothetical protein [Acinetobacter baumannii]MCX3034271.1 hypothetical protein [Acinetobacter baumannii]
MHIKKLTLATLLFGVSAFSYSAAPITVKNLDDSVIPVTPVAVVANGNTPVAIEPEVENSYEKLLYEYQLKNLNHVYAPKTEDQMILPVDIADMKMRKIYSGYETTDDLANKKDKLSVYLSQNKQAQHFVGLYKQRVMGWHDGLTPRLISIEQALNEEALFPFLDIVIDPKNFDEDKRKYFEKRLNLLDFMFLQKWLETASGEERPTVREVLAQGRVLQKIKYGN